MTSFVKSVRRWAKRIPGAVAVYKWLAYDAGFLVGYEPISNIKGSRMHLDVWCPDPAMRRTFRAYARAGEHEPSTTHLLSALLEKGDTFVDLGANIGYFSLLAARKVGPEGKVYSFEPEPRNFRWLEANRELNHYSHMTVVNKAVSDSNGVTSLFICPYDTGHHTLKHAAGILEYSTDEPFDRTRIDEVRVETIVLDDFLRSEGCGKVDVIKMDVEGAEWCALQGMKRILEANRNIKLVFEYFPLLIEKLGCDPTTMLEYLVQEHGFVLYEIAGDYHSVAQKGERFGASVIVDDLRGRYRSDRMFHVNILARRPLERC